MTDSMRLKLEIIGGAVLLVLMLFVVFDQYRKAVDNASAEAAAKVQQAADKKLDETLSAREKQHNEDMKEWADKFASLKQMTPQQIVVKAPEYVPALQGKPPIVIVGPETQPAKVGDAIVPQQDIKPLAEAILDGQQCRKTDLPKVVADLSDWKGKYETQKKAAEDWQRAAQGGSWLKRLGKNVLKVGVGVGIGYALHR